MIVLESPRRKASNTAGRATVSAPGGSGHESGGTIPPELSELVKTRTQLILSLVLDNTYLLLTVLTLALLQWAERKFHLEGVAHFFFKALEITFAASTFVMVCIFLIADIAEVVSRARHAGKDS